MFSRMHRFISHNKVRMDHYFFCPSQAMIYELGGMFFARFFKR